MSRDEFRKVSQRDFVQEVREHTLPVSYEYPGVFITGATRVQIRSGQLGNFLAKLAPAMSFENYDRLTKEVWVAHIRAEDAREPVSSKPVTRRYPSPKAE